MGECASREATPFFQGLRKVLGKYRLGENKPVASGTSTSSYRGFAIKDGTAVAIIVYNMSSLSLEQQFKHHVATLLALKVPFPPAVCRDSHPLSTAQPEELFVQLLDYSRGVDGLPGAADDGKFYVVTEWADFSLQDRLRRLKELRGCLTERERDAMALDIVRSVAGLHAQGLAHLNLKPDNFLIFGKRLKLGDVDGCVPIGSSVSIEDDTISYSPFYCAPEWARFVTNQCGEEHLELEVTPHLDAWSLGIILCELVSPRPVIDFRLARRQVGPNAFVKGLAALSQEQLILPEVTSGSLNLKESISQLLVVDDAKRGTPNQLLCKRSTRPRRHCTKIESCTNDREGLTNIKVEVPETPEFTIEVAEN